MPAPRYLFRQLQAPDARVSGQHVSDLLPGVVHVLFGVGLHNVGAERGGNTEARIKVELVYPVRGIVGGRAIDLVEQALGQGVPPPIKRRRNQRIGIVVDSGSDSGSGVGVGRRLLGVVILKVDEFRQRYLKLVRIGLVPVLVFLAFGKIIGREVGGRNP